MLELCFTIPSDRSVLWSHGLTQKQRIFFAELFNQQEATLYIVNEAEEIFDVQFKKDKEENEYVAYGKLEMEEEEKIELLASLSVFDTPKEHFEHDDRFVENGIYITVFDHLPSVTR